MFNFPEIKFHFSLDVLYESKGATNQSFKAKMIKITVQTENLTNFRLFLLQVKLLGSKCILMGTRAHVPVASYMEGPPPPDL